MYSTPLLDSIEKKAQSDSSCLWCQHLRRLRFGYGCNAHDKLLLPDFLPIRCKDYTPAFPDKACAVCRYRSTGRSCNVCRRNPAADQRVDYFRQEGDDRVRDDEHSRP